MRRIVVAVSLLTTLAVSLSAQDWSLNPTYGRVTLSAGFSPDPYTVSVTAGGSISASGRCSDCTGYVANAPDFDLYYTPGSYALYIYVESSADTTLLINAPDQEWYGSDDALGRNPMIVFSTPQDGLYDIWVGTYGGESAAATLYISEIAPSEGGQGSQGTTQTQQQSTGSQPSSSGGSASAGMHPAVDEFVRLMNQHRRSIGLSALIWSDDIARVAQAHSEDMARRDYFSHTNLSGQSPFDRLGRAGIGYSSAGENIAYGNSSGSGTLQQWLNSSGHRANIENGSYTHHGVGFDPGSNMWTHVFVGNPR